MCVRGLTLKADSGTVPFGDYRLALTGTVPSCIIQFMLKFPDNFLWGAATSAYQVEGNNTNSDWWEWERRTGRESSGAACRHYELYPLDFDLAKNLNHNAHRLSIEWSRIEPQEADFSEKELQHYRDVILALKERAIEPVVTLHHFTNPAWLAKLGGWQNKKAVSYFLRYVEKVAEVLADKVKYWVTINEPMVYIYFSYIDGSWPPQKRSFSASRRVENNLALAHLKAYKLIHAIYKKKNLALPLVGIAQNMQAFLPCQPTLKNRIGAYLRNQVFNHALIARLKSWRSLDFIGLNYYTRSLVEVEKWGLRHLLVDECKKGHHPAQKNSLGWDIYPQGLYQLILTLKRYHLPVFILENGICTDDDGLRWEYIYEHLKNIHRAVQEGADVRGYFYWSLLDNYEWDKAFKPRFGIVEVDYNDYKRTVRESGRKFAAVCKNNGLD